MRCADAMEKASLQHPDCLQPNKKKYIHEFALIEQQEVRWHLAQIFPRLNLTFEERAVVIKILMTYINDKSNIVKTFSMQALTDLSMDEPALRLKTRKIIEKLIVNGSSAMKSRGKKLLKQLDA